MSSPTPSDNPDSRTSSVGRKREFNQLVTVDHDVITVGDGSSVEELEHMEKRVRHGSASDIHSASLVTRPADSSNIGVDKQPGNGCSSTGPVKRSIFRASTYE